MRPEDENEIIARAPRPRRSGEELIIGRGGQLPPAEGFTVSRLVLEPDETYAADISPHPEVVFVQDGSAEVRAAQATVNLAKGDTITVPRDLERSYRALREGAELIIVRGTGSA
jgi:quercetin dioxygenase-like cupin family protein